MLTKQRRPVCIPFLQVPKEVVREVIKEVIREVPVEVPVEVIKEVRARHYSVPPFRTGIPADTQSTDRFSHRRRFPSR